MKAGNGLTLLGTPLMELPLALIIVVFCRIIELMLGMLIIAWLATQYGRLIRQRILASKFKNGGPGTGTGGGSK